MCRRSAATIGAAAPNVLANGVKGRHGLAVVARASSIGSAARGREQERAATAAISRRPDRSRGPLPAGVCGAYARTASRRLDTWKFTSEGPLPAGVRGAYTRTASRSLEK
jgi:hypothetical protein